MRRDDQGTFRDKDDRIVIADGSVHFLGATPHDGLIDSCAKSDVDLFIFDWDWRRRIDETAKFFVGKFLPFFRARVIAAGLPDPLSKFSLIGHSSGGMNVNLILRGNDPIVANMACAITVATPFYGYAGQAHRWFEGERYLNGLFGKYKKEMIEVISSLPGLYTLHFLDEITYNLNKTALAKDPDFPLNTYPSMDATTAGLRADPFNPKTNGTLVRYPANAGFDRDELDYARLQFQQLAAPMPPNLLEKFYNIRGVRAVSDTIGSVSCGWISPKFDHLVHPSPIVDAGLVPGDDTQPAWTTRLVINNPARCITVTASDIRHMLLMNHALVLNAISRILCAPGVPINPSIQALGHRQHPTTRLRVS